VYDISLKHKGRVMRKMLGLMLIVTSIVSECSMGWSTFVRRFYSSKFPHRAIGAQVVRARVQQGSAPSLIAKENCSDIIDRLPNTRYTLPLKRSHEWQRATKSDQNKTDM